MARNWFAQCRPSRCSCQLRVDHHNPGLARPRVACDNAEIPRTLAGNGKAAGRNEVAVLETRNSAAKPSTASISQRRRPQRAETAVSSLSAGLVSKLYGTGGKAIHRKSVKRPLKQPARTARLRLVFPSGKAWATSARQYRSAAGQTFRFRTPGIQISAVSKVGPPVSAADD